ncbi:TetR/AcrR family transcriptional regulator [Dactylosporangium roseum]|uniref:TetR/AcrR family transcriptional regulator n=1 Tax=Dactylosporangium roseum TaxID=47989 RepID=A0ABY5ZDI3_9ACTN|nr:TetR/AcrR family transcriptional regulator [Dactylosporangium roseum]UWZ39932.1 TetR/AcrR family transcriptional regulator [Dactylosporangium roseum]
MARSNTRDEILAAAARQFAAAGFKGTSLHDIAVEVGCSKAALLYHFDSKEAILTELCAPAIAELAELDTRLTALGPESARVAAIEGFVDLVMRYRKEIQVIYGDLPALLEQPAFQHVQLMTQRLQECLAGSSATLTTQVAAKIVLAGVSATAFACTDHSDEDLRPALIEAAGRILAPLE